MLVLLQLLPSVLVLVLPRIGIVVLLTKVVWGDNVGTGGGIGFDGKAGAGRDRRWVGEWEAQQGKE